MNKKIIGSLAVLLLFVTATVPAIAISTPQQTQQINTEQHRLISFTAAIKIFQMINNREHRLVNFNAREKTIPQINDELRRLVQLITNSKTPTNMVIILNRLVTFTTRDTRNIDKRVTPTGMLDVKLVSSNYLKTKDFPLDNLFLTISQIRVHRAMAGSTYAGEWITIPQVQPTADLDLVTLLDNPMPFARLGIPLGQYDMVEITISNAKAILNGVEFKVIIPQSTTLLKTPFSITLNQDTPLIFDFNVMESIQQMADHSLILKPTIQIV